MTISHLYQMVNNTLREEDFIPASVAQSKEEVAYYRDLSQKRILPYEEIAKICEKFGINPENVYFTEEGKTLCSYLYYDFPVLVDITSFNEETLSFTQVRKRIEVQEKMFNQAKKENDYGKIIALADSKIQFIVLEKIFPTIPDEEKYTWFIEVYTSRDYGFQSFPKEIIEEAFSKQTSDYRKKMFENVNQKNSKDELILYRGKGSLSAEPEDAYSWTLDFHVAVFFASRFNDVNGEIHTAKIKKKDIVDYLTGRSEAEIIVRPGTVYDIQGFGMINTEEEIQRLNDNYALYDFHRCLEKMDKELFFEPDGIHGFLHMKRVLLHTISLAEEMELDDIEKNILYTAALYHDIGRVNDEADDFHGMKSWQKLRENGILERLEDEDEMYEDECRVLQFIIENHCLPDEKVWENLESFDTGSYSKEETRKLMEVFKDADGLDRVRLGDLDVRYLRTDEAKRRILFAKQVLHGIQ